MKLRTGPVLLQLKLTLIFIAFGLAIGYSSYFITTIANSNILANLFLDQDRISAIFKKYDNDWMLGLRDVYKGSDNSRDLLKQLIPSEYKKNIVINFYFKNSGNNLWYLLMDSSTPRIDPEKTGKELTRELENTIKLNILDINHSFFNFNSPRLIFINITRLNDTHKYVMGVTINRKDLLLHFIRNKSIWLIYTTIIFLISLILGFIFAQSISIPIRKLSDAATALSRGNLKIRFKMKRKDTIGELSHILNDMAIEIENRIKTIETMNKIDKTVNSSLSREVLLGKITEFISCQFSGSGVFILEKESKYYNLLAYTPDILRQGTGKIPFSNLPNNFSLNDRNIFKLNKEDISSINKYFSFDKYFKSGVSFPIAQSGILVGRLLVLKEEFEDREINSLNLLAEQVSVALLNIKEDEEKRAMYNAMLLSLTRSIDTKSKWTAGHSERVAEHALKIAKKLGLDASSREKIRIASLLHDIGKLGVPEFILDKPDKLTDAEFEVIKKHPVMGEDIIKDIPHFSIIKSVVRNHHERWDGKGYPDGLSKDATSLAARIVSIADVWDAITADRPYRMGFSHTEALEIMKSERGKLFDPALLDIFINSGTTGSDK